ncbi:hypothetical protein CRD36_10275 [Paremcibacter congregatus]|uniref:Serine hydrolase n=2 Tax=Paremcibacter congregatus TaxID=2043170 RepID=A0A2G4YQU7_9PROT|nr:hypothetical protein CRD36_10275 [Paremcibacter congregatus]QDE29333.1 serine hydrolase [Paremcibacter congregatus]
MHLCLGFCLSLCLGLGLGLSPDLQAKPSKGPSQWQIKKVVRQALDRFNTPGMAVSIVHKGKIVHLAGYGKRDYAASDKVDADTLFSIASTTKAFTTAALAILVDEGKLGWDDLVTSHLPDFKMADPWVTGEFTIRDLLTHRSGLGPGAGDLMLWPEPSGFSRTEIIHNLRHLDPVTSFRSEYAYDNLLYIVAGEVVAVASGTSWEEFVQTRILDPLNMACYSGRIPEESLHNVATPHGVVEGKIVPIPRNAINGAVKASAAAGGMVCNVRGMARWMMTQLQGGVGPEGNRLFSEEQRDEMWRSHTILPLSDKERAWDNTHFKTYGLGWRKADVRGYEVVSHTGTLSGMQAYLTLVPELEVGIMILSNGSNSAARSSVMQTIVKSYMGAPKKNWIKEYTQAQQEARAETKAKTAPLVSSGSMALPAHRYVGLYRDRWFGQVEVRETKRGLRFRSIKSIQLQGNLEPFEGNTFIVRWDNRNMGADAYVSFTPDEAGKIVTVKMIPVSEDTDFSFDFQDLLFHREK